MGKQPPFLIGQAMREVVEFDQDKPHYGLTLFSFLKGRDELLRIYRIGFWTSDDTARRMSHFASAGRVDHGIVECVINSNMIRS